LQFASSIGLLAWKHRTSLPPHDAQIVRFQRVEELSLAGARIAFYLALRFVGFPTARIIMNLTIWLPAMFLLGLATLGLMFAFLAGCEKV
jgi:hypothetical protein